MKDQSIHNLTFHPILNILLLRVHMTESQVIATTTNTTKTQFVLQILPVTANLDVRE